MSKELSPAMYRSALIAVLRDPTLWPEGFEWDFMQCSNCALGLADELFNLSIRDCRYDGALGLSEDQASLVFVGHEAHYSYPVTPEQVADRLEILHNQLKGISS